MIENEEKEERKRVMLANHKDKKREERRRRRHRHKEVLINSLGGCCEFCNKKKELTFHHLIPAEKKFVIGKEFGLSMERLSREANKCILLCKKCHTMVHQIGLIETYKRRKNDYHITKRPLDLNVVFS